MTITTYSINATGTSFNLDIDTQGGQLSANGDVVAGSNVVGQNGNFSGNVSGVNGNFSGDVSGVNGNFSAMVNAPAATFGNLSFSGSISGSLPSSPPQVATSNYGDLPASPTLGLLSVVTDSSVNTWGATVGGGGSDNVLAWYNGTVWTVIGA